MFYNDKTNRKVAEAIKQVVGAQPAKVQDHKPTAPLNTDMVERVVASGMRTVFTKPTLKEEVSKIKECGCDDSCSCCETPIKEGNFEQLQSTYGEERPSISNAAATLLQAKKNKSRKSEDK